MTAKKETYTLENAKKDVESLKQSNRNFKDILDVLTDSLNLTDEISENQDIEIDTIKEELDDMKDNLDTVWKQMYRVCTRVSSLESSDDTSCWFNAVSVILSIIAIILAVVL